MNVFQQLDSAIAILANVRETLKNEMAAWERKEYEAVEADRDNEVTRLRQYIAELGLSPVQETGSELAPH